MIKLEKTLCRPVNVAMLVDYDIGFRGVAREMIGEGFSNIVSYVHRGALVEYRPLDELAQLKAILDDVFAEQGRCEKIIADYRSDYAVMKECLDRSEEFLYSDPTANDVIQLIEDFGARFQRAWGPTLVCQWYPLWVDRDQLSTADNERIDFFIKERHERDLAFVFAHRFFENICSLVKERLESDIHIESATPAELKSLLSGEITPEVYDTEFEKREHGCVVFKERVFVVDGVQGLKEFAKRYQLELPEPRSVKPGEAIRGETASPGKVTGKVRHLFSKWDMSDLQQGEIVVSPMTSEYFEPVLDKAAAIVTDEGGITCHAAIVSRELGIPCIIGTEFATEALSNGDLIEVDADVAEIRIVKQNE